MKLPYKKVVFEQEEYSVINVKYKEWDVPILLNYEDGEYIKNLNKKWKCTDRGLLYCTHEAHGALHEIYMHEIIMAKKMKESGHKLQYKPIVHLNRIGIDNRRENLLYDLQNKDNNKNIKKKKRIIELPEDCGFQVNDIPTYVWYLKPNDSHGERFIIEVDGITWKTASSKFLSLKYKLEEAKKFLRELKESKPDLFEEYCMNGEYTKLGKELMESYFEIVKEAGYEYNKKTTNRLTDLYLKECTEGLTSEEISLLHSNKLYNNSERITRRVIKPESSFNTKLLETTKLKQIPEYCYYKKATQSRGDYFVIEGHPKLEGRWQTSTSKFISTKNKLIETLAKLSKLNCIN